MTAAETRARDAVRRPTLAARDAHRRGRRRGRRSLAPRSRTERHTGRPARRSAWGTPSMSPRGTGRRDPDRPRIRRRSLAEPPTVSRGGRPLGPAVAHQHAAHRTAGLAVGGRPCAAGGRACAVTADRCRRPRPRRGRETAMTPRSLLSASPSARRPMRQLLETDAHTIVVLTTSKDPDGKVTVLLLPRAGDHRAFVVKVPSTDGGQVAVEREIRLLEELAARPLTVGATIPRLQEVVDIRGRPGFVTELLPGRVDGHPLPRVAAHRPPERGCRRLRDSAALARPASVRTHGPTAARDLADRAGVPAGGALAGGAARVRSWRDSSTLRPSAWRRAARRAPWCTGTSGSGICSCPARR